MFSGVSPNAKYNSTEWIGKRFNMLTVIGIERKESSKGEKEYWWTVKCDCGNIKSMRAPYVVTGHNKSCGCFRANGGFMTNLQHGETKTRLHTIWLGIRNRCLRRGQFPERYIDRGITICDEWLDYENFARWARTNGYDDSLSIERIDNDGNYCPENCKWIKRELQARNRGTTHWVEWRGRRMSLAEACEIENMPYKRAFSRMNRGWPLEKALTTPVQKFGEFDHRKGARAYEKH